MKIPFLHYNAEENSGLPSWEPTIFFSILLISNSEVIEHRPYLETIFAETTSYHTFLIKESRRFTFDETEPVSCLS
jgi:hypothetical protein